MAGYLTPEQEAEFIKQLESQGGALDGGALTPEEQQQAVQEGAQMAAEDAANGQMPGADAPAQPTEQTPEVNADARLLQSLGFGSLGELANAYKETLKTGSEMREMLTQFAALHQAMENNDELDPNNPEDQMRRVVRSEFAPLYEKQKADIRNRLIQEKWGQSAAAKADDLSEHMDEIQAMLKSNPRLAMDEDGLQRAYDAVRSKKYRSEASLMADAEFLKKVAANPEVKRAVLEEHLQGVARTGDAIPQGITGGGNTPLTGRETITSMTDAKNKLAQMLGMR